MVDVDGMGRAFPELQMVTFTIGGIKATPMALVDEKGNSCIFETITNKWTGELARSVTMSCGASVSVSLYPMSGKQMKEFGVHGIVTRSRSGNFEPSSAPSNPPINTAAPLIKGPVTMCSPDASLRAKSRLILCAVNAFSCANYAC